MPRNGSGIYSLPPVYLATTGATIEAQQHNDPLVDLAAAMTGSLATDGQTPMTGNLQMNSRKITGLAAATNPADAVRFDQISDPSAVALATLQSYGWAVVGNAPTLANLDATNTASGQYRFVAGATGTFPTGVVAADTGQIIVVREAVNEGSMILAVGAGRVFWRALVAGAWGAWQEFWLAPANTAQGSLLYRGAAGVEVLAPGAAAQILTMNSGATAPEWAAMAGDLMFALASGHAGADVTTAQSLFPKDVTLDASSVYQYELVFAQNKTAGANSHRIRYLYGGTAGITAIQRNFYMSWDSGSTAASSLAWNGIYASAAEQEFTGNIAFAGVNTWMQERGVIITSTAGTFIPQYRLTVAPGGAYATRAGSYFRLRKLGASGANIAIGPWA